MKAVTSLTLQAPVITDEACAPELNAAATQGVSNISLLKWDTSYQAVAIHLVHHIASNKVHLPLMGMTGL